MLQLLITICKKKKTQQMTKNQSLSYFFIEVIINITISLGMTTFLKICKYNKNLWESLIDKSL